jgi:aryl-alcohol dehydrogenase-like predicted oxidoreductase
VEQRALGMTGLTVSALGFGAGAVGGLMVHGTRPEREAAVRRAIQLGVTLFDTAPSYGDGRSERQLGDALRGVDEGILVSTKVAVDHGDLDDIAGGIRRSVQASLRRLGRDSVDLLQLHNPVERGRPPGSLELSDVLDDVVPALLDLRDAGTIRMLGLTAGGDTDLLRTAVASGAFDTVQVFVSLLNPSAAYDIPRCFPAHDFHGLLAEARERGVGVLAIRVLASGALGAEGPRHPYAGDPWPMFTSGEFARDQGNARWLAAELGVELPEAALRFVAGLDGVSAVLVGISSIEQLEQAAASIERGPLPKPTVAALEQAWAALVAGGEA